MTIKLSITDDFEECEYKDENPYDIDIFLHDGEDGSRALPSNLSVLIGKQGDDMIFEPGSGAKRVPLIDLVVDLIEWTKEMYCYWDKEEATYLKEDAEYLNSCIEKTADFLRDIANKIQENKIKDSEIREP